MIRFEHVTKRYADGTTAVDDLSFEVAEGELVTLVGEQWSTENYGIGLRKGDTDGQAAVNAALRKMIDSGSWRASLERHLAPSGVEVATPPEIEGP